MNKKIIFGIVFLFGLVLFSSSIYANDFDGLSDYINYELGSIIDINCNSLNFTNKQLNLDQLYSCNLTAYNNNSIWFRNLRAMTRIDHFDSGSNKAVQYWPYFSSSVGDLRPGEKVNLTFFFNASSEVLHNNTPYRLILYVISDDGRLAYLNIYINFTGESTAPIFEKNLISHSGYMEKGNPVYFNVSIKNLGGASVSDLFLRGLYRPRRPVRWDSNNQSFPWLGSPTLESTKPPTGFSLGPGEEFFVNLTTPVFNYHVGMVGLSFYVSKYDPNGRLANWASVGTLGTGIFGPAYAFYALGYEPFNPGEELRIKYWLKEDNNSDAIGDINLTAYVYDNTSTLVETHSWTEEYDFPTTGPIGSHNTEPILGIGTNEDYAGQEMTITIILTGTDEPFKNEIFDNFSTTINVGSPPSLQGVLLESSLKTNFTNENLIAAPYGGHDEEGDPIYNISNWFVNGESITVLNMPFEGSHLDKTFVRDYSGKENHGNTSSPGFGNDRWNRTAGFDDFGVFEFDFLEEDHIQIPTSPSLNFGPSDSFTMSAWVKPTSSNTQNIISKSDGTSFYELYLDDSNYPICKYSDGTETVEAASSVIAPNDEWTNIVCVRDTENQKLRIYVEGDPEGTTESSNVNINLENPGALYIGADGAANTNFFDGYIDHIQIYNRALTPEQIQLMHNSGDGNYTAIHDNETRVGDVWYAEMTPNDGWWDGDPILSNTLEVRNRIPTHSTPILNSSWETNYTFENLTVYPQDTSDLDPEHNVSGGIKNIFNWFVDGNSITTLNMPFEGGSNSTYTKDYSGNNYDGIVSGATWNRTGGYDEKGAYEFDGVNSYIDTSIVSNDYFTSSDGFTLSVWIYALDSSTSWTRIIDKSDGINASNGFTFSFIPEFKRIAFRINEGDIIFSEDDSIILENWHHVSASVNQSGNITLYIDGIKSGAPGYSNDLNSIISSNKLRLGNWAYNLNRPFNGSISEVQIYNRALSPEQIKALYENRTDLIVSQETRIGEVWHVEVTPNDGFDDGATLSSNNIPIEACDEWIDGLGCVDCDLSYEGRLCERNPGDILTISGYCAMNTSSIGDWYCEEEPVWANWTVNHTNFDYTNYVADECAHLIGFDLFGCRQNFDITSNYTREGTCIQEECCLDILISGEPTSDNRPADPNWRDGNELCGCNLETMGMFCDPNYVTDPDTYGVCIVNTTTSPQGTCCEFDNIIYANKTTEELAANKFQLDGTERCGGDCAFINEACSIDFTRGLLWEGACLPSEGGLQCLPKPVSDCDLSFIDNNCGSILLNMTCNASLEKVSFEYYGDAWITITSDINREGHDWLTLWHTQNIPDKTYQVRATAWDFVGGIAYSEKNIPVNNSNLTKPVIEFPSPGSVVNGTFNIEFSGASTYAEIQFDGGNFSPTTTLSTHLWNTTEFTDSTHTIRIRADDENCGWIYSDYLTVEVDNSREGIHILTPRDNEIISGDYQVEIMGPSWAREVLIYVENSTGKFALDGSPGYTTDSDGSDGFNQIWETAEFADGTYTITANATRRIFFGLNSYTVTATRFNITIDNAAVQPPSNLRVYDHPYDNDGIINLEWDLSTTPNVIAYNIYRDVMPDFNIIPSKLIATVDSTTNTYTETLPDGTYYWAVTALTPASESSPSNYNYTTIDTVLPIGTLWANQTYIKDGDNITYKYIGDEINYVVTLDTTIYDNEGEIISLLDDGVLPDEVAGDAVYTGNSTMISGKPDGNYTVTAVVNDSTNLFYPKTSIIVDNTEPFASIQILSKGIPGFQEQNPAFTATRDVLLNLSFSDNYEVKDCRYKNEDPDFTNINWEPCVTTKEWLLIDQDGSRTVYYQVRDKAGNINTTFDSIYLNKTGAGVDVTPPEGLIVVDQGPYTKHNSWLYAYWHNASDHENELLNLPLTYKYRIINNDTELNITEWIDVGTSTEVNHTGLNLADNTTYAFEVAVFNAANLNQTEQSSGVKVDTILPEITDITAYNADNLSEEIPADTWVPIRNILFNFTGYDNISGVNAFSYLLDDNPAYSPGIVSYWRAEGNALDSVGSNHGTLMNNVSFTEGISGQAFEFDDGRVDTFNLNDMHPENFTISFWVKNKVLDNEGIHPRPFHGGATGSTTSQNAGFSFRLQGDNKEDVAFLVRHPSEEIEHGKTVVTHLGHDSWTFITGTKEQLKINLYKNGSLVGSEELEHIEYRRNFLMHVGGTGNFYFNGSIDEIAIFNRAISSKEALQFYSAQSPYFLGPDNIWEVQVSNQTEEHSSVTYRNLEDGIYYFMVKALDAAGNWGFYDIYKIKIDATPPTKPTILDKTLSSDGTSLNVSWSESTALSGIDVYHIEVLNSSGEIISSQTNESIPGSQRDYLISGLTPGQEYKVVVRARSNSGLWSLWSDEIPVDTREPEVQVDDMVPSDTSNVLAGEQVFYIRTNQTAICEYKIEDEPYRQFRFTNSTYHEDMRTVTTNFKWYVRCTTLDGVNESEHDATVYVSTEISDPEVTIKTPNIYSGQKFLAEISTGLGGLPKREFTIKLNKTEVDIDEVSIVDVGGGNYQLTMRAPETPNTYNLTININEASAGKIFNVLPLKFSVKYSGDSEDSSSYSRIIAGKSGNITLGIASSSESEISTDEFSLNSTIIQTEGYIFVTPSADQLRTIDRNLRTGRFKDLAVPSFGERLGRENSIYAFLEYDNIIINKEEGVQAGSQNLIIRNNGLTADGKVNITIRVG